MKFSHTIEVNNPHNPQLAPLTRQQLWLGLVLRAKSPKLFMPHLDQCDLFDPTDSAVTRELRYGDLIIRDRVTFHLLEQVHYAVPAQGELTTASNLVMRIEEEQPDALSVRFEYDDGQDAPVKVLGMSDDEQEAEQIAILISAHRFERRTQFSDYAILYRGNHQARVIEQSLRKERIPYTISGGQSFFDKAEIKDIVSYLRLVANQDDDPAFIRAVTTPRRGVGQSTLETLGKVAGQWQCSLFEAVFKGGIEGQLADRQLHPLRTFCTFINQLEAHAHREGHAAELLDDMMKEINYESYLYDSFDDRQAQSKWQNTLDFTTWLKEKGSGKGKNGDGNDAEKSLLDLTQMVALMTMLEGRDEEPDAVRMSTLHASKGLEFPHVFLVGVEEGILPHKGDPDAPIETLGARIEEERRLMYVGITRAQRTLHVSWCKKRKRARESVHCDISRFIKEMKLDEGDAAPTEAEILTPQQRLANLKSLLSKPKPA